MSLVTSIFVRQAKGNIFTSFRLILPLVLAMAANAINQFADRVFLSRYSDVAIQASLPGGILSWLFICLVVAVVGYSGTFAAQFWGAGSKHDAAASFVQGIWLSLAFIPLILLSIPFGFFLFDLCGHAPDVAAAEKTYYGILQVGGIFCAFGTALSGYFTGIGRTRLVGVANAIGNLANILLDWMFIFGTCGCGEWGIAGAGWATVISAAIPCLILGVAVLRDPVFRGRRAFALARLKPRLFGRIVRYGVPSGIHVFLDVVTFTVFVMLTGRLDAISFAASNVGFAINHLSFAPLMGLSQGATVLVGQFQGEGDSAAATRATCSCLFIGLAYVAIFVTFILSCSDMCVDFFRSSSSNFPQEEFRSLGRLLLTLLSCWAAFDAVILVVEGALKGAGDTRFVMMVQLGVSFVLWMPLVFLVMRLHPTIGWMWGTMPIYCGTFAILVLARFLRGGWRSIRLVQNRKVPFVELEGSSP